MRIHRVLYVLSLASLYSVSLDVAAAEGSSGGRWSWTAALGDEAVYFNAAPSFLLHSPGALSETNLSYYAVGVERRLSDWLSAGAEYSRRDLEWTYNSTCPVGGCGFPLEGDAKMDAVTVLMRPEYELGRGFSAYLVLGLMRWRIASIPIRGELTGTNVTGGFGFSYSINQRVKLHLSQRRGTLEAKDSGGQEYDARSFGVSVGF